MDSITSNRAYVTFNPLIFASAAIFSLVTVIVSSQKPCKMAGRISPVEAMRYTDGNHKVKQKQFKKSTNGAKVYKMALANIMRNKKKLFW